MSASPARRLRDYQATDTDAVRAAWRRGIARVAIVWATGLGKSDPIAVLATEEAAAGGTVWILAHRGELLTQLRDRCHAYAPGVEVGRVQAQDREHHAPIIVATVQTMARLVADNDPRLRRPTLVIVDEAHHAAAMTYERIMRWAGCYEGVEIDDADGLPVLVDPVRALGVTATMNREEKAGLGLGDVWQEVVAERGIVWGIDNGPDPADPWRTLPVCTDAQGCAPRGWLVPLIGRAVVADRLDLSTVKISRTTNDYADKDLGDMVAQDAPDVVKAWYVEARLPDGSHRQTAVFVPTLDAAAAYLQAFRDAGIATSMVDGKTPAAIRGDVHARTGIYGELATGTITVLVSVGVLTEGWDCPPVSCILAARPTKLDHLYQQFVGRGTRPCDERDWPRADGTLFYPKINCLVLDVVGITATVSLRTLVNLVPGAPYKGRPCSACGQPRPCGCIAADPGDDGSEDYDAPRGDKRRRLVGPQDYRDVDLLSGAREAGLNWLMTIPQDGYEGIPFLKIGERGGPEYYAILWHNDDDTWSAGWVTARGAHDGEWVIENATRRAAQDLVESLEIDTGDPYRPRASFAELAQRRDAPWRLARKRATPGQQSFALSLGIAEPENLTSGACGDEIERALATRRLVDTF